MTISRRDEARDRSARKINGPVKRVEALQKRVSDLRVRAREPELHRWFPSAERIARATCRLDWRSTCGSDGAGVWMATVTRTSREAAPIFSIRPLLEGEKSSGPFSPTTYDRPALTGPPVARPGAPTSDAIRPPSPFSTPVAKLPPPGMWNSERSDACAMSDIADNATFLRSSNPLLPLRIAFA